jgi:catechol-2,3-dioxygenase
MVRGAGESGAPTKPILAGTERKCEGPPTDIKTRKKQQEADMANEETSVTPVGVNHVVLNVRDMEESHRFWTEIVGLKQVGALRPRADMGQMPKMQFYSGDHGGKMTHHDVALVENPNLPPPPAEWELFGTQAINHIAIAMPNRESWLKKLEDMQAKGVKFNMRVNHGVTHSVYINDPNGYGVELLYELPREMWETDIDAGLNYLEMLPTEGKDALRDDLESAPRFGAAAE